MVIAIISEQRSGSCNLYLWMNQSIIGYKILWEFISSDPSFQNGVCYDKEWFDETKNYIVHEKYSETNHDNVTRLVESADITVTLYREDTKSQIESYIMVSITGKWYGGYAARSEIIDKIDTRYSKEKEYVEKLKRDFKNFREEYNLKSFTYEDLYYRNKIDEFKKYLGLKIDTPFPYGNKYRVDNKVERLI